MTHVIKVRNVREALPSGLNYLTVAAVPRDSRNGPVLVAPGPVVTEYEKPCERVLLEPLRDANPFFHLFESLWMLEGHNDVAFVSHFASGMGNFSDDGSTLHGAYGPRWRWSIAGDQIDTIIDELKTNPESRRCVLQMWDAGHNVDLHAAMDGGKDVPCNTHCYFDASEGKLNMTVCCRSNDVVWGAYGANAVHFSVLLEYVALSANLEVGVMRQFSNNYHIYTQRPDVQRLFTEGAPAVPSIPAEVYPPTFALLQDRAAWDRDCELFFTLWHNGERQFVLQTFAEPFFVLVVRPLANAYAAYKQKFYAAAIAEASQCQALDWSLACIQWLERRYLANQNKGVQS